MSDENIFQTPDQLLEAYNNGFLGGYCDPQDLRTLLGELPMPLFGAAAYELEFSGEGKLSLPYLSLVKFDPGFGPSEAQTTGDCVSHSTRNAVDVSRAVEIDIKGEAESFEARGATEAIYGIRGHGGQGMSCSQAVRFINQDGGILLRKKYDSINLDLSKYNANIGISWGTRGVPSNVKDTAKKNQVKTISLVQTVSEARDAIANGYALTVCSDQGFSSMRDENGIAAPKGSWSHAMCWCACDDTRSVYNETLFLIVNSWGVWNAGPKKYNQPDGSFWIRQSVAERMLAQRGSFAVSNFDGFPARRLPNYGFGEWL